MSNKKPRILFYDIETTPILAYSWSLWPTAISHDSIVQDWSIICGAWKFHGESKVHAIGIKTPGDDYEVVKRLRDVLASADVVVHHNGDSFDLKKLNARLIYHKLPPLPKLIFVDTKKEAKKVAAFSSNKLDYLGEVLTGKGKVHVDYSLWLEIMKGSKKALKEMIAYNKVDVIRLEEVYDRLAPYMKNPPHLGAMAGHDRHHSCRHCGSENVKLNGVRYTAAGLKKQEIQCKDCHGYSLHPIK